MSVPREASFLVSRFPFHGEASAHVAQSVEHVLGKDGVTSSILVVGSIKRIGSRKPEAGRREEETGNEVGRSRYPLPATRSRLPRWSDGQGKV